MTSRYLAVAAFALSVLAPARPASAQDRPDGFLLEHPRGTFSIRGGLNQPRARSDIFTFVTRELTLDRADFRGMTWAVEVTTPVSTRWAWTAGLAAARTNTASEFRAWTDNRDLPIEQTTGLTRLTFTGGVKAYLADPGRGVGRFAWIPARVAPYVGGGAGLMRYSFGQHGDFIDFETLKVFYDKYHSGGLRPMAHAFAGLDISVSPRFVFTTEARYERAQAKLGLDFSGFAPIDLSGVSVTTGVSIRY